MMTLPRRSLRRSGPAVLSQLRPPSSSGARRRGRASSLSFSLSGFAASSSPLAGAGSLSLAGGDSGGSAAWTPCPDGGRWMFAYRAVRPASTHTSRTAAHSQGRFRRGGGSGRAEAVAIATSSRFDRGEHARGAAAGRALYDKGEGPAQANTPAAGQMTFSGQVAAVSNVRRSRLGWDSECQAASGLSELDRGAASLYR